jgi:hypothetical protein
MASLQNKAQFLKFKKALLKPEKYYYSSLTTQLN